MSWHMRLALKAISSLKATEAELATHQLVDDEPDFNSIHSQSSDSDGVYMSDGADSGEDF